MSRKRAFLAGCGDPRNIPGILALLKSLGLSLEDGDVTPWLVFGGIGNRRAFDEAVTFAMEELAPPIVIVTAHEDCRKRTDINDLKMAMSFVETRWPGVELIGAWINLDGTWDVIALEDNAA